MARAKLGTCVGAHSSTRPPATRAVQLIGSIAACAR
jgi:hypothetical protein